MCVRACLCQRGSPHLFESARVRVRAAPGMPGMRAQKAPAEEVGMRQQVSGRFGSACVCLDVVQRYLFPFCACVHGVMLCASVHVCFDSSPLQTRTARGTQRRCLRKLRSSSIRITYVSLFMHPRSHEGTSHSRLGAPVCAQ